MAEPAQIWVRSIKHHTYWNIAREPGTFYPVDNQQDADTVVHLKFAVLEALPQKAVRPPTAPEPQPVSAPAAAPASREATPVGPITAEKWPTPSSTTKRRP